MTLDEILQDIHIPPDVKHHRVPAPGLSFAISNLPFLIREAARHFA